MAPSAVEPGRPNNNRGGAPLLRVDAALSLPFGRAVASAASIRAFATPTTTTTTTARDRDDDRAEDSLSSPPPSSSDPGSCRRLALVCCRALLRSRRRTYAGSWEWRPRRMVLVPAGRWDEGGEPVDVVEENYCGGGRAALLLLYPPATVADARDGADGNGDGDDLALPCGAIRLVPGGIMGDEHGAGDVKIRLVVSSIPDHPLHVEVQIFTYKERGRASAAASTTRESGVVPEGVYAGTAEDGPRRKRKIPSDNKEGEDETSAKQCTSCHGWRLKFPDEGMASLWCDALRGELRSVDEPVDGEGGGGGGDSTGASSSQHGRSSSVEDPTDGGGGGGGDSTAASSSQRERSGSSPPWADQGAASQGGDSPVQSSPPPLPRVARRRISVVDLSGLGRRHSTELHAGGYGAAAVPTGTTAAQPRARGSISFDKAVFIASLVFLSLVIINFLADSVIPRALLFQSYVWGENPSAAASVAGRVVVIDDAFAMDGEQARTGNSVEPGTTNAPYNGGGACALEDPLEGGQGESTAPPSPGGEGLVGKSPGGGGGAASQEPPSLIDFVLSRAFRLAGFLRRVAAETTKPSDTYEVRPPIEGTAPRRALTLARMYLSRTTTAFAGGGYIAWVALPAGCVLAVSLASMMHRACPRLGEAVWSARHGCCAVLLVVLALCAGQDAYVNYLRHPLEYGLCWEGWIRSMLAAGYLLGGGGFLKKALGLSSRRHPLSPARKAAAGLSTILTSLAVPLALRSVQEGRIEASGSSVAAGGVYAASSVLSFFVGLYFFGRAMRHLRVGGFEVGKAVHEASLLPARLIYRILWVFGDATHLIWTEICWLAATAGRKAAWLVSRAMSAFRQQVAEPVYRAVAYYSTRFSSGVEGCWREHMMPVLSVIFNKIHFLTREIDAKLVRPSIRKIKRMASEISRLPKEAWQWYLQPGLVRVRTGVRDTCRVLVKGIRATLQVICDRVLFPVARAVKRITKTLFDSTVSGASYLRKWTASIVRILLRAVVQPLLKMLAKVIRFCLDMTSGILRKCYDGVRILLSSFICPLVRLFSDIVVAVISHFVKKVWQLVAVAFVFNTSYRFAVSSIVATGAVSQAGFGLGSWSLFLVGYSVARAVVASQGSIVDQYLYVDHSVLRHVDFHFGYAIGRLFSSGWHALSLLLRLILHATDFVIRETARVAWNLVELLHERGARPLLSAIKNWMWCVWNSPFASAAAAVATLLGLYLHCVGVITIPESRSWYSSASGFKFLALKLSTDCTEFCSDTLSVISMAAPFQTIKGVYMQVYDPVVEMEATSPSVGFGCWVFLSLVKWTQTRFRIKLLAAPIVLVYFMEVTGFVALRAFAVSYVAWILMSFLVGKYESEQQRLAVIEFSSFRQRGRGRSSAVSPSKFVSNDTPTAQSECCICLEDLLSAAELPCGHQFHGDCIKDWLEKSHHKRCPICRRATGGWDRVLEVVF